MKSAGKIERWCDWPADVAPGLRALNHARRVSFVYRKQQPFTCMTCREECEPSRYGVVTCDNMYYCDDCTIKAIREDRWV